MIKEVLKSEGTTTIPVSFVFSPGSAELTEAHRSALSILTPSLIGRNFTIRLQGFAWREGLPRRKEWSLAFDRAYSVMRYLVDVGSVKETRIEAMGYGPPEEGSRGRETQLSWGRRSVVVSIVQES